MTWTIEKGLNENQVVASLAQELGGYEDIDLTDDNTAHARHGAVLNLEALHDAVRGHPRRMRGTAKAHSLDSFIELCKRHQGYTVVYADMPASLITGVLNEHVEDPGFRDHRVTWSLSRSNDLTAWLNVNDKWLPSDQLAEVLEDRILDLLDPGAAGEKTVQVLSKIGAKAASPSEVLGVSKDIAINVKSVVKEARNLSSGETQMVFQEEHTDAAGKPVTVPRAFLIAVPLIEGGPRYVLVVRLRYRVRNGGVVWQLSIVRLEDAQKDVLQEILTTIRSKLETLVVEGSPE